METTKGSMLDHLDIGSAAVASVAEHARIAVGSAKHEAQLIDLAEGAKAITAITNADGYKEAHATRMTLKNARLSITKTGKAARDDATAFAKSVIEEEKRLIAIIEPDEERINALQEQWDAAIEAEKQRKIAEETARVEGIKTRIEAVRRVPLELVGQAANTISTAITHLDELVIDASYAEHQAYANLVREDAHAALTALLVSALEAEAEQERIVKEREELALLREQQRQADVIRAEEERQRAAAEAARLRQEREEANRKEYAARAELEKQQAESARLAAEIAALKKADADRIAAERKAEEDRLAAEQRAAERRVAAEKHAADLRAAEELESANRLAQTVAQQEEENRINQSIPVLVEVATQSLDRPSDDEILAVLADHFDVSKATAYEWITSISTFTNTERLAA